MKIFSLIILFIISSSFDSFCQIENLVTDKRDGKAYKIVKIGNQVWMAENLAFNVKDGSWPLEYKKENEIKYGLLYTWDAAQKSCPAGWHLPTIGEWQILIDYLGEKAISNGAHADGLGWKHKNNATNSSGFSVLPGGYVDAEGFFSEQLASFWTSSEKGKESWYINIDLNSIMTNQKDCKGYACFSIRCIKD